MSSTPESTIWTVHMAARRPRRAVAAVVVMLLALAAIHGLGAQWPIMALAVVLLVGSIAEFLFPVTYTLDAEGAHARHLGSHRVLPWAKVRRIYLRRTGIKLSPLTAVSWVENYRGIMLRTPERDAVLSAVRAWTADLDPAVEIIDESIAQEGT